MSLENYPEFSGYCYLFYKMSYDYTGTGSDSTAGHGRVTITVCWVEKREKEFNYFFKAFPRTF